MRLTSRSAFSRHSFSNSLLSDHFLTSLETQERLGTDAVVELDQLLIDLGLGLFLEKLLQEKPGQLKLAERHLKIDGRPELVGFERLLEE